MLLYASYANSVANPPPLNGSIIPGPYPPLIKDSLPPIKDPPHMEHPPEKLLFIYNIINILLFLSFKKNP